MFASSADGATWSSPNTVRATPEAWTFSTWFDGTFVYYAAFSSESLTESRILYYRRGTPNANGAITWSAAEGTVWTEGPNQLAFYPSVVTDSNGYPYVAYPYKDTSTGISYVYVAKSSTNDGTWNTANGYPRLLQDIKSNHVSY